MATWLTLPQEPLYHQKDQLEFLEVRRRRWCKVCQKEFIAQVNEDGRHPNFCVCGTRGIRIYDHLTIIAGRRFGKSLFGSIAGTEEAAIPGTIGWACAPTNPKLHRYVIPAFQRLIPREWVEDWNSEFKDLRLINGSLIHFQTLEDPDQGRGQGLDWLWIDEVCELTQNHWNVISPSLADKQGVCFFTTSPRGYDWVYKELYKPAEDAHPGYWGLHARTADNPIFHTQEGADYLEREKGRLPDAMYRQEYEADFVIFEGAVYGGHIDSQILRTSEQIQSIIPEWPAIAPWRQVLVGLDSGADHPFGAVKLVATERGLVVVGEYLERHRAFIQHCSAIKALSSSHGLNGSSPPPKWAMNRNEAQPMIELAQHGIYCQAAENEVVAGTERVKSWLHCKQLWFVEDLCPRTISQMKSYRWAPDKASDGQIRQEKVFKLDDELPDCLRYALMTWPQLPKPQAPIKPERDISNLPEKMQQDILRLRKMEREPSSEPTVTGDFYL